MKAKQYTIRQVPPSVDKALRRKAAQQKTSLNAVVLHALEVEAGVNLEPRTHHDLDAFFGSWVEDKAIAEPVAEQRRIEPGAWD